MKTDLNQTAPEVVAKAFLQAHPFAVTIGVDIRRTKRYWFWHSPIYRQCSEAAFDACLTRWLDAHYCNLRRLDCKHVRDLITQLRFIGHLHKRWLTQPEGIAANWRERDLCVTRDGIVNVKLAVGAATHDECVIEPTPALFCWELDSALVCEPGDIEPFVDSLASEANGRSFDSVLGYAAQCAKLSHGH